MKQWQHAEKQKVNGSPNFSLVQKSTVQVLVDGGKSLLSPLINVHVQCLRWCKTEQTACTLWLNWMMQNSETCKNKVTGFASFEMLHTLIALISPVSPPYPCWQVWEVKFAPVQRYSRRLRLLLYQALEMSTASLPSAKRLDQAPGKHGDFWVTWSMVGFLRPCLPGWW